MVRAPVKAVESIAAGERFPVVNRVRTGYLGGIEEDGTSYFPQRVWLARGD